MMLRWLREIIEVVKIKVTKNREYESKGNQVLRGKREKGEVNDFE